MATNTTPLSIAPQMQTKTSDLYGTTYDATVEIYEALFFEMQPVSFA